MKVIKIIALLTPCIISVVLLMAVIIQPFTSWKKQQIIVVSSEGVQDEIHERLQEDYNNAVTRLESKGDILLSVVGIAVSVWIGLNVYNVVEKSQTEQALEALKELGKLTTGMQVKLGESEEKAAAMMTRLHDMEANLNKLKLSGTDVTAVFG